MEKRNIRTMPTVPWFQSRINEFIWYNWNWEKPYFKKNTSITTRQWIVLAYFQWATHLKFRTFDLCTVAVQVKYTFFIDLLMSESIDKSELNCLSRDKTDANWRHRINVYKSPIRSVLVTISAPRLRQDIFFKNITSWRAPENLTR